MGLNAGAVIPGGFVDVFIGGGVGVHFLGVSDLLEGSVAARREQKLGGNLHSGVDLRFPGRVSLFALSRIDILAGDFAGRRCKVQVGARYGF